MTRFYSTQNKNSEVALSAAVMKGLADDGGLFMPREIPRLPVEFFSDRLHALTFSEVAYEVSHALLQDAVAPDALRKMIDQALTFDAPLQAVSPHIYSLELFHGPTLSFKDFGARFMAQLMGYFVERSERPLDILVATSGDTGSAIAQAFLDVPGVRVWILYPSGKVSFIQEQQLTTLGHNITALEIEGTFDDCQKLVKRAFADPVLQRTHTLTSANSINIARLIPQMFYYFYAYAQLKESSLPVVFSVPCGNFGNLTAGLIAKRMGLPVHRFVAATNVNNSVPKYLETGVFTPHPSKHTLSNAMDVGNPSNFARMLDLYNHQREEMKRDIFGVSFTDEQTKKVMQDILAREGYLLDPHGAVAYLGLQAFLSGHSEPVNGIFLETAHPAKFADDVEEITSHHVVIPERLQTVLTKEKQSVNLSKNYDDLRNLLQGRC